MRTVKNFVNLTTVKGISQAFSDYVKTKVFTDAASGVVRERDLVQVDPKVFEKKYPALAFWSSGVIIDNSGGYSMAISSLRIDGQGGFATVGTKADDNGKITLNGDESILKVKEREAHSDWTTTQVQQGLLGGVNIVQQYLQKHDMIYKRELDSIMALGVDDIADSTGLLNYAGFTSVNAASTVDLLTGDEQYAEISGLIDAQHSQVSNTPEYMADVVVMPTRVYNKIKGTILNSNGTSQTVLKALQQNYEGLSFVSSEKGDNEVFAGNSVTVAYSTNEESMKLRLPVPLEFSEVDSRGRKFYIESAYRVAGMDILEDSAGYYLRGL